MRAPRDAAGSRSSPVLPRSGEVTPATLLAFPLGALAGAVLLRFGLCFGSATRLAVLERKPALLASLGLAAALQAPLLPLLAAIGAVALAAPPLRPLGQAVGGLVFGVGLALAGGCIAGLLFRTGVGSLAALVALAAFVAGELAVREGPLAGPARSLALAGPTTDSRTLGELLDLPAASLAIPIGLAAAAALVILVRGDRAVVGAGAALAGVGLAAWIVAETAGYGYGLGYVGTAQAIVDQRWYLPLLALGTIVGAGLAGRPLARGPRPDARRLARAVAGGLLMGASGTIAAGCNVGHLVGGAPQLALGSLWTVPWMALGVVLVWRGPFQRWPAIAGRG